MKKFMYSAGVYIIDQAISVVCRQEPFVVALRFRIYIESVVQEIHFLRSPATNPPSLLFYLKRIMILNEEK